MRRTILEATVLAVLPLAVACIVPRIPHTLAEQHHPRQPTAILPVNPELVQLSREDSAPVGCSRAGLVDLANQVLDAIAPGAEHLLLGPSAANDRLAAAGISAADAAAQLQAFEIPYPARPGNLAIVAQALGVPYVVIVSMSCWGHAQLGGGGGVGISWHGQICADAWSYAVAGGTPVGHGSGCGDYDGAAGIVGGYGGVAPIVWATTRGRAADQALRAALTPLTDSISQPAERPTADRE